MLTQLREYLKMGLGGLGECQSVRLPRSFPLIISSGYVFHRTEMMGCGCIVALAVDGISYTPRMVQKQLARVSVEFGVPVVFVTRTLHPHDKERYLAVGQPLVVPGKFAYLPFAGTKQDDARRPFVMTRDTLAPISQLIVLAFLEHRLAAPVLIKDVQELLGVTPPAVQNAFKEIEALGLAERVRMPASKALGLAFVATGRALWEKAQPFLVSPVKRTVGLLCAPCAEEGGVVAGADALAEISRLNVQDPKEFALPLEGFAKRGGWKSCQRSALRTGFSSGPTRRHAWAARPSMSFRLSFRFAVQPTTVFRLKSTVFLRSSNGKRS